MPALAAGEASIPDAAMVGDADVSAALAEVSGAVDDCSVDVFEFVQAVRIKPAAKRAVNVVRYRSMIGRFVAERRLALRGAR